MGTIFFDLDLDAANAKFGVRETVLLLFCVARRSRPHISAVSDHA